MRKLAFIAFVALLTAGGALQAETQTAAQAQGTHGGATVPQGSSYPAYTAPQQDKSLKLVQLLSACLADRPANAGKIEDLLRRAAR